MQNFAIEAARFIATHADEPIQLADVADHVGYSVFHLAKHFERQIGQPPGQFLAAHRFQRAKELLLTHDDKIIDICFAVGFNSVGTFTRRFVSAVGMTPIEFRRLPHLLADRPPRPVHVPGVASNGGVVTGSVRLSEAARSALGDAAAVYIGLFPKRAPRGVPISGSLLDFPGDFTLTSVPPGTYWLLASALDGRADPCAQLAPSRYVVGGAPVPIQVSARKPLHHREIVLDVAPEWTFPVLVALPPLAVPIAQERIRHA